MWSYDGKKKIIKKIDTIQNPDSIQTMIDAAGMGYQDKFPTKLAARVQPVILINPTDPLEMIKTIYPIGSLYFSTLATNPASILGFGTWAAFGEGRYIVSVPAAGTGEGTSGTALSDTENRPVGQHNHSISDGGHVHNQRTRNTTSGNVGTEAASAANNQNGGETASATTGITIDNEGAVAGTNAPYIQIFMWKRTA